MLTKEALAQRLNGRQYRQVLSKDDAAEAKASGLVVVFGYSDDGVEVLGAEDDQLGACNGSEFLFTAAGLLRNECDDSGCPYFAQLQRLAVTMTCHWSNAGWSYTTAIPHATFDVIDDGHLFCKGIVFALADVALVPARTL